MPAKFTESPVAQYAQVDSGLLVTLVLVIMWPELRVRARNGTVAIVPESSVKTAERLVKFGQDFVRNP